MQLLYLAFLLNFNSNSKNISMGRGDKKTKKGKIFKGSFGKSRPASVKEKAPANKETAEKSSK
jgi:30S ribosomal protein S31